MQLRFANTHDIERTVRNRPLIIIPIGSTEQHGPSGFLGTDHLCADGIALRVGETTQTWVAPTISVGMSQHHMAFAGSMTLRPTTLIAILRDTVIGLHRHGFTHFFFINGHGGNTATLSAAFSEIYMEADVRCASVNWWQFEPVYKLARELFGEWEGYHATPAEISVTAALYPNHFKPFAKPDLTIGNDNRVFSAADFKRRYPDGRMASDPSLASAEHGFRLIDAAVTSIGAELELFFTRP